MQKIHFSAALEWKHQLEVIDLALCQDTSLFIEVVVFRGCFMRILERGCRMSFYITIDRVKKNCVKELANVGAKRFVFCSGC